MVNLIEQAIENCYMTHKHENPGVEDGMCAGLRTMNGEGEPPEECKECKLYYGYADEHDIKQTNVDRIHSMAVPELAEFILENCDNPLSEANDDMCYYCKNFEDETQECNEDSCKKAIIKWLQSEVEEQHGQKRNNGVFK